MKLAGICAAIALMAAGCAGQVPPQAQASAAGMDSAQLAQLGADVRAGRYGNVHSLLVYRHGRIAYEQYFSGADERRGQAIGTIEFDAETLHDARSVTKSVVGILFGLAVRDGRIPDLDAPVLDYFPEYAELRTPERLALRLRHLLSMSSGLDWDEGSRPYGDPANSETAMDAAADPYRYVLERPVAAPPGTRWEYSGGDTMLLAGVIERATGMRLEAYADRALFRPLGISRFEWLHYPGGQPIAASGLRLRPRDMAKLGLLYLHSGRWNGRQLVPEAWVRDLLTPQAHVSDRPLGLQRYGYQWYLGTGRVGDRPVSYQLAVGWGGQRIMLVPEMDMVMVMTAGMYGDPRQTDVTFEILLDRILPAGR